MQVVSPRCLEQAGASHQEHEAVIYFNEVDRRGHFAAWEEPGLFSEEIRAAFRPLRA
jgi:hypothetical protein